MKTIWLAVEILFAALTLADTAAQQDAADVRAQVEAPRNPLFAVELNTYGKGDKNQQIIFWERPGVIADWRWAWDIEGRIDDSPWSFKSGGRIYTVGDPERENWYQTKYAPRRGLIPDDRPKPSFHPWFGR